MNIEKYTQKAQEALASCQEIAVSEGHQQIDGEHLHLALMRQQDGLIPKLVKYMGVDAGGVTADLQKEMDKIPKVSGEES